MNYCKKCGARLEDGAKFCTSCGTKCDPPKRPTAASPRQHWFSPPPPLEETPAQEQPASQPQEAPEQEQPVFQPQEGISEQKTQYASEEFEVVSPQRPLFSYQSPQGMPRRQPPFTPQSPQEVFPQPQPPQEMFPQQQPQRVPPQQEPPKKNSRKPLLIVLFSLIGVLVVLGIVFLILFLSKSSAKAKTFDMTCSQYTAEMNRIMGENKLKEDKWKITEANAAYVDEGYKIDLDLDKDSQKIKSIKVGSTDSEEAAKIAAVSIMTVEPDADQDSSLKELAELKEGTEEIVKEETVVYIDETEKEYVIEPKPDDKKPQEKTGATTASSQASQTGTTQPQTQTTAAETTAPTETTAPKTEPTTEKPTEDAQKSAYSAYLEYLQNHSGWFNNTGNGFSYSTKNGCISLKDINSDGIPEMVFLRPADGSNYGIINLCILTYKNSETVTMYDDQLIMTPGAGPIYKIFVTGDSELYSVASDYPISYVTRYDISGDSVSAVVLANSIGHGTDGSTPVEYYIGGEETTMEEYNAFYENADSNAETYLIASQETHKNHIAMTYDSACDYLRFAYEYAEYRDRSKNEQCSSKHSENGNHGCSGSEAFPYPAIVFRAVVLRCECIHCI